MTYLLNPSVFGGTVLPVFHALDTVSGAFSADVIVGTGSITEARTSTIYCPDDSNIYQSFATTVPGEYYHGAQWWLYHAPALTNHYAYSNDQTNLAWTKSAGLEPPLRNQTGMTGAANTACLIDDQRTGASEQEDLDQAVSIANDSSTHTVRYFILKDTDETRYPEFEILFNNGTIQRRNIFLNTKTGATADLLDVGTSSVEVNDAGLWWEVLMELTNNTSGNTVLLARIWPAASDDFATEDGTVTGSIVIGNAEFYKDTTIKEVRGSGPIFTANSSVTVNATDISFDDANHSDTEGGYFFEFTPFYASAEVSGDIELLSLNSSADLLYYDGTNSQIESADGTNTNVKALTTVSETAVKCALAYGSSSMRVNVANSWGTAGSYDAAYPTGTKLEVCTPVANVHLTRNIRRYDQSYADVQSTLDGLF
jgi:hypothetical protein